MHKEITEEFAKLTVTLLIQDQEIQITSGREIYLHCGNSKECNPDIPVTSVLDPLRLTAKLKTSCPASNPNSIWRGLAERMEIKPCWICPWEYSNIPCDDDSKWKQSPPTHSIQNSMNLNQTNKFLRFIKHQFRFSSFQIALPLSLQFDEHSVHINYQLQIWNFSCKMINSAINPSILVLIPFFKIPLDHLTKTIYTFQIQLSNSKI